MTGIIWYKNKTAGEHQLDKVIEDYKNLGIDTLSIVRSFTELRVVFDNDDVWRALPVNTCTRGIRCNISYIQHGIPQKLISQVIFPMTSSKPYSGWRYYD